MLSFQCPTKSTNITLLFLQANDFWPTNVNEKYRSRNDLIVDRNVLRNFGSIHNVDELKNRILYIESGKGIAFGTVFFTRSLL